MIITLLSHFAILGLCFISATAVSTANITCGPRGAITMAGSPSGVPLAMAWAKDYQQACRNSTITVASSNSIVGAQRVCGLSSAGSAVDVGIRSRPFQSNEATTTNGYNFKCGQGNKTRTAIQVKVALGAFVLVVAPNGGAAYCIKQLLGNGLTLEEIRILFSNYTPAQILDIPTPSPSFLPLTPPPVFPPVAPPPVFPPSPPISPAKLPTQQPTKMALPKSKAPFRPVAPTRRPARPTARPTFPTATTRVVWGRFPHPQNRAGVSSSAEAYCNNLQALAAGPPRTSEVHQDFARRVLNDYGRGEGVTPRYFSAESADKIVNYLQANTNAIAFLSLPGYVAYQSKLQLVNVEDVGGKNRAPNSTTLTARLYPLSYDVFMEVRSDDSATLARLRPFFTLAYSSRGSAGVVSAGLVPLSNSSRVKMLSRLMVHQYSCAGSEASYKVACHV